MATTPVLLRLDEEILAEFKRVQPGRGDLPQFVTACLTEYIKLWGNRPTPQEVAADAVRNIFHKFG